MTHGRAGPLGVLRWAFCVVFGSWPWWPVVVLLLANPAMLFVTASLGLIMLPAAMVAACSCLMPWVMFTAQYLWRVSVRVACCSSPLVWVAAGRLVLFPPQVNSLLAVRLTVIMLVGRVHLSHMHCIMASFAAALVLAGDLPLGLCKAACLAALVWPTFGREEHPGYAQAAMELPGPVSTPPDGWCFYYCWVCWLDPKTYLAMARWPSGHLKNRGDQNRMLTAAQGVHEKVLGRMRSAGDEEAVRRLRADPSDLVESDFQYFAAAMGCSIEVGGGPRFPVYGSPRPVGLRVRRYQSRDASGDLHLHYDILSLWERQQSASSGA